MEISAPNPMGFSGKNLIINGNFVVNQRGYASGTAVGAIAYTLDRWRDGNGGNGSPGGFTFAPMTTGVNKATSPVDVVVTVPAGSILQQPIEPLCLSAPSQPYTLSWAGTATGNLEWYDGSTYHVVAGSSPLTIVIPPNVSTYVQFSNGTVSDAQLEIGTTPTPFERRPPAIEFLLCARFCRLSGALPGSWTTTTAFTTSFDFSSTPMRAAPSIQLLIGGVVLEPEVAERAISSINGAVTGNAQGGRFELVTAAATAAGKGGVVEAGALLFTAEL